MQEAEAVTQKLSPGPQRSCRKLKFCHFSDPPKGSGGDETQYPPFISIFSIHCWFSRVEGGLGLSRVLSVPPPSYARRVGQVPSASAYPKCSVAASLALAFGAIGVTGRGGTLVQLIWGQDICSKR